MEKSQIDSKLVFENFMKLHDEAYKAIEDGKRLSISGDNKEAIVKYKAANMILKEVLNIQYPSGHDVSGKRIQKMKNKMKKDKKQVLNRISICKRSQKLFSSSSAVMCHELDAGERHGCDAVVGPGLDTMESCGLAAVESHGLDTVESYGLAAVESHGLDASDSNGLVVSLRNINLSTNKKEDCILYTHPKAHIYFNSPNGSVNTSSYSDTLQVVKTEGGKQFYLQVGRWKYSLEPGTSSWSRTKENKFIFHEPYSKDKGDAVAITLGTRSYESDPDDCNLLYNVLSKIVEAVPSPVNGNHDGLTKNKISDSTQAYIEGAGLLIKGAELVSEFMNNSTPELIRTLPQASVRHAQMSPDVLDGIRLARNITETAARFTDSFVSDIACNTRELTRTLAPSIQSGGTRLLTEVFDVPEYEAAQSVGNFLQVAASAVDICTTIFSGARTAVRILGDSLVDNTVKIVDHKYGSSAAAAAGDVMYTVGNSLITAHNISLLVPKTSVKQITQGAGKNINGVNK